MMRATAAKAASWTIVRSLGRRAIPTNAARTNGASSELVIVQTWPREDDTSLRDARALMSVRHANVAKVREVVEGDGEISLVTQFVEGQSLADLRAQGSLPLAIELRILVDALTGLAALHAAKDAKLKPLGFTHGEIAPANVIVGTDGVARVVQLAGTHAAPGAQGADTTAYLAPEILLADDAIDHRVDVYGIGVMLWEALAQKRLFQDGAAGAIVTHHLSGRIQKASVPSDAPWAAQLADVAAKAIATDPSNRHATANELAADIKRIAKTNLAPTAKVAALVKERGAAAIEARRNALGTDNKEITGARPKIAAPHRKEPPKPATGDNTTKPGADETDIGWSLPPASTEVVSTRDLEPASSEPSTIDLVSIEDDEDSAVKVRATPSGPPPAPSVHDRITDPNPIDARAIDALVHGEEPTVPPTPVVAAVLAAAPAIVPPPAPVAAPVVAPPAPFAPTFVPVERDGASLPPVFATPAPEPVVLDDTAERDKRRKRAALIFLAVAFLFCVIAIALRPKKHEQPEAKAPEPRPTQTAAVVKQPELPPAPEPTLAKQPDPPAPPSPPTATATSEPAKPSEPEATPPPASPSATTKPATKSNPKPKPTYDPLGI